MHPDDFMLCMHVCIYYGISKSTHSMRSFINGYSTKISVCNSYFYTVLAVLMKFHDFV